MKNRLLYRNPFFWIKGTIFAGFLYFLFIYFSNTDTTFYFNSRMINLSDVNSNSLMYLWQTVKSTDIVILVFITIIILLIFVHVILFYQNNLDGDQSGH